MKQIKKYFLILAFIGFNSNLVLAEKIVTIDACNGSDDPVPTYNEVWTSGNDDLESLNCQDPGTLGCDWPSLSGDDDDEVLYSGVSSVWISDNITLICAGTTAEDQDGNEVLIDYLGMNNAIHQSMLAGNSSATIVFGNEWIIEYTITKYSPTCGNLMIKINPVIN